MNNKKNISINLSFIIFHNINQMREKEEIYKKKTHILYTKRMRNIQL